MIPTSSSSSSSSVSHASIPTSPDAPLYTSNSFDSVNTLAQSPSPSQEHIHFSSTASTPAPSRPLSFIESCEYDGPTRVGSPVHFGSEKEEKIKGEEEDMESKREEEIMAKVAVEEFPEGGLRAWLALAGSTLVLTCTFSISNSFGTFLNYYKQVSILFLSSSQSLTYDFLTFIDTYSTNSLRTIPQRSVGLDRLTSSSRSDQLSSQAFFSIKDSKSQNSLPIVHRIPSSPSLSHCIAFDTN